MSILEELCLRLPWGLSGYLLSDSLEIGDSTMIVELKGVDLSKDSPLLIISVPGFKSTWICSSPELFIPILKPNNGEDLLECLKCGIDYWDRIKEGRAKCYT